MFKEEAGLGTLAALGAGAPAADIMRATVANKPDSDSDNDMTEAKNSRAGLRLEDTETKTRP